MSAYRFIVTLVMGHFLFPMDKISKIIRFVLYFSPILIEIEKADNHCYINDKGLVYDFRES